LKLFGGSFTRLFLSIATTLNFGSKSETY